MNNEQQQQEFVEKRLEAHRAGTAAIETDWLVRAAIETRQQTQEVLANWKRLRTAQPIARQPERRRAQRIGSPIRRQAD